MRTSRLSRETAQRVDALSPTRRRRTRQSLQDFANEANDAASSPILDDVGSTETSTLGKRKRDTTTTPTTSITIDSSTIRRSPRKAAPPRPEEDEPSKRKARRQPAKRIKGPNGAATIEPPANWEQVYNTCAEMRKRILAPVDTMGCESLAEEHRSPRDRRLQTLVSLMLSSQTKDTVTAAAMKRLQEELPGGFTLDGLLKVEPVELNRLIEKVGFHNNKTKFIKSVAVILRDEFDGDIPDTAEGLISLPGVGPKMAYLCLSAAWGKTEGIGVDVHVHRITNLWGWHKTSTPEQTRMELESWLPRGKWHEINHLLVGLGQTVCLPVGRRCGECDLGLGGLCPGRVEGGTAKRRVKREVEPENGEELGMRVKVERDDVRVKIEVESNEEGMIEAQALAGAMPPTAIEEADD